MHEHGAAGIEHPAGKGHDAHRCRGAQVHKAQVAEPHADEAQADAPHKEGHGAVFQPDEGGGGAQQHERRRQKRRAVHIAFHPSNGFGHGAPGRRVDDHLRAPDAVLHQGHTGKYPVGHCADDVARLEWLHTGKQEQWTGCHGGSFRQAEKHRPQGE